MKTRGNGLKANTPRPATVNIVNMGGETTGHSWGKNEECKHGEWIFACAGCYNENIERIDSKDPAAAGRRAAKASGE
jgi:sulfatase maturation enzyme AslB (radical SAM superfamily)